MSKFTVDKELQEIEIEYLDEKNLDKSRTIIIVQSQDKAIYKDKKFGKIKAYFLPEGWKEFQEIYEKDIFEPYDFEVNGEKRTRVTINESKMRDKKLRKLLKKLVIVDSSGQIEEIKVDAAFINDMKPNLAASIIDKYEESLMQEGLGDEIIENNVEEKKDPIPDIPNKAEVTKTKDGAEISTV